MRLFHIYHVYYQEESLPPKGELDEMKAQLSQERVAFLVLSELLDPAMPEVNPTPRSPDFQLQESAHS